MLNLETSQLQQTMTAAYERWQDGWTQEQFWAQLSERETFAVYVGNLNYQVENGGFSQWWGNNYANTATVTTLLVSVGLMNLRNTHPATAEVESLIEAFLGCFPNERIVPEFELHDEDAVDYDRMNELDRRYYKVNEQFMVEAEAYLVATFK